jgi:peptide deformylase
MPKYTLPTVLAAFLMAGCASVAKTGGAMSLEIPENQTVVQQTRDLDARRENPLYLPMRKILPQDFRDPTWPRLLQAMRDLMHATGGIGIAANQVGKSFQVFMIEAKPTNPRYQGIGAVPYQVFVNPRIVKASKERRNFWHGCLSAVGEPRGNLATYESIDVAFLDEQGAKRESHLNGLAAVIFQHELRHLLGGTYLDKARQLVAKDELDRKLDSHELPFFDRTDDSLPLLLDDYRVGETLEDFYGRSGDLR